MASNLNPPGLSVPSTWFIAVGTVIGGADVTSALAGAGLPTDKTAILGVFSVFLIGIGSWLSQHGH